MALPWIQVDAEFVSAQAAELAVHLDVDRHTAIGLMVDIWNWCRVSAMDGHICGPKARLLLASAANWRGDPDVLVTSLSHVGLLQSDETGVSVLGMERYEAAMLKSEKDKARLTRQRKSRELLANVARTSRDKRACVTGETETEIKEDLPDAVASDGRQFELVRLDDRRSQESPMRVKPPPKPSAQMEIAKRLLAYRSLCLGPRGLPDKNYHQARINSMLKPVVEVKDEVLDCAFHLFMGDSYALSLDPPCPLGLFASNWSEWVSKALKVLEAQHG